MRFRIYFKGLFAGAIEAPSQEAALREAAKLLTATRDNTR